MENVIIRNAQGEQININVVRYFRFNGIEYLVFSLNEIDDGGYVKLYISRINGELANTIVDDVEWNLIKDTVKTIIKSNKENLPLPVVDLDARKLANVQVVDQKVFKLSENFIQLLSSNKNVESYIEPTQSFDPVIETQQVDLNLEQPKEISGMEVASPLEELVQENLTEPVLQKNVAFEQTEITPTIKSVINDSINLEGTVNTFDASNTTFPTSNNSSEFGNNADYGLDYQTLYKNELNQNKLLNEEIEKYKSMINDLKRIIDQAETF